MLLYRGIGNVGFYLIFIAASCQLTLVIAALIQMYQGRKTSTPTARKTYSVVETLERNLDTHLDSSNIAFLSFIVFP